MDILSALFYTQPGEGTNEENPKFEEAKKFKLKLISEMGPYFKTM